MRHLILRSFQSPGDVLMLTAAVRDLHRAHPRQFQTDVRTSAPALWENNPYLTPLREDEAGVETLDMHYPLIHQSNQRPFHFIHGYAQYLEQQLAVPVPVSRFQGDLHLSAAEKCAPPPGTEQGVPERFWVVVAGGKYDFTAKWWDPAAFQEVIDHFRGRIVFVQCGEQSHWHPRLRGVVDLVGHTSLRDFVRLVHYADGVLCPVTLAMHLAAAVETRPGGPPYRPCVVVAGGREPVHWEAYPHHQFLSTVGALPCCAHGGCWRSRCQLVGDGDEKDRHNLCEQPVQVTPQLRIPRCMHLITPADLIRRIELYYEGGALNGITPRATTAPRPIAHPASRTLLEFRHGLGDAVQLTIVLKHLQHHRPSWEVDVASLVGKHSAFHGLCRDSLVVDRDALDRTGYRQVYQLDWHECRFNSPEWPSTKAARCLVEVFELAPIPDLFTYTIQVGDRARSLARRYLKSLCKTDPDQTGRFPAVLLHYQGNTSSERKDLPHALARAVCEAALGAGMTVVILDWDGRSPLPDGVRIHCPGANHELWGGTGTGDAESLAALIEASSLMVGVDSGPLHVAGATTTPTLAIWTGHHPVHFYDLADNVLHLVPGDHARLTAGGDALAYFMKRYRHQTYKHLYADLSRQIVSMLGGKTMTYQGLQSLTATSYDERYYEEHRLAGLDYLVFGDWQRRYGRWFVEALALGGKRVLDVGCACGSILRSLGEAGAVVQGVDLNEHTIRLGREKWPDMANLLFICDAVNLHLFTDASWDAIHTAQVAEHWRPEHVPLILRELHRVTTPNGLLFCCLDTTELFARQGRRLEDEDPTHVCIRPLMWWYEQLANTGWQVCSSEFEQRLRAHPESFLADYDWDWFIARRIE